MNNQKYQLDLSDKGRVIVVVGATTNREKYGYRVLVRLRELGFSKTIGVNPKYEEIEGAKCYATISDAIDQIPSKDMLVVTVVPPEATEQVVEECGRLGIKTVWMQPGSESKKAVERAKELGIEVAVACIVVDGLREGWGQNQW